MTSISFKRHRFPPEIIQHAVWLYARFTLSFRDVEDLLVERGIDVSNETVRRWFLKFGRLISGNLRRSRPRASARWHLDEMVIKIRGRKHWLWRAVDDEGDCWARIQHTTECPLAATQHTTKPPLPWRYLFSNRRARISFLHSGLWRAHRLIGGEAAISEPHELRRNPSKPPTGSIRPAAASSPPAIGRFLHPPADLRCPGPTGGSRPAMPSRRGS